MSRNCLGVAVADGKIGRELEISDRQMAWVMAAFFASYSVFQIPSGWIVQVVDSRRALAWFASVWSAATAAMGLATGFLSLLAAQLSIGLAQAGVFPASTNSIGKWMPGTRRAVACGWLVSCMSAGGALAVALTGWMLQALNWRWVFVAFCLPGLIWAMGFYLWFRDRPDEHRAVNQAERNLIRGSTSEIEDRTGRAGESQARTHWKPILTSVPMWFICGQQFFRAAGYVFYGTWFPKFLKETRGVSTAEAGYLTSLPLLATVLGALISGFVVDWILARTGSRRRSRQSVAVSALAACAVFSLLAFFTNDAAFAVCLVTAGSFCAACAGPCAYAIAIDMGGKEVPVVFSLMNTAGNVGAFLCPIVVERLVAASGNWNLVLLFFAGVFLAATLCWMCLNPEGTVRRPGDY
ncbi:MAG: MFS transporter [Verrucomicrobia bacterium]|nr:MFS transporter [Verrucomicrobiota bacterium]